MNAAQRILVVIVLAMLAMPAKWLPFVTAQTILLGGAALYLLLGIKRAAPPHLVNRSVDDEKGDEEEGEPDTDYRQKFMPREKAS